MKTEQCLIIAWYKDSHSPACPAGQGKLETWAIPCYLVTLPPVACTVRLHLSSSESTSHCALTVPESADSCQCCHSLSGNLLIVHMPQETLPPKIPNFELGLWYKYLKNPVDVYSLSLDAACIQFNLNWHTTHWVCSVKVAVLTLLAVLSELPYFLLVMMV